MVKNITRRDAIKLGAAGIAGALFVGSGLLQGCSPRKKKVIAINGSARKDMNTAQLLEKALEGVASEGVESEIINLYDYTFKGCVSCLRCKLKDSDCNGLCAYQDAITPVLDKCQQADAILIGSPIYYDSLDGQMRCFLERLMFPLDPYSVDESGQRKRFLDKTVPVGAVYAMNAPSQEFYKPMFDSIERYMGHIFGHYQAVYSCNTYQFKDYERYDVNLFPVEMKARQREEQFPKDLEAAYEMGKSLVMRIAL